GLCDKGFSKAFVARDPVSLSESDEMTVPVQLPGYFLVARNSRVKVIYLAPMNERGSLAAGWLETPVNRIAKVQIIEAKQIEPALDRSLGQLKQRAALLGKALLDDR